MSCPTPAPQAAEQPSLGTAHRSLGRTKHHQIPHAQQMAFVRQHLCATPGYDHDKHSMKPRVLHLMQGPAGLKPLPGCPQAELSVVQGPRTDPQCTQKDPGVNQSSPIPIRGMNLSQTHFYTEQSRGRGQEMHRVAAAQPRDLCCLAGSRSQARGAPAQKSQSPRPDGWQFLPRGLVSSFSH